MSITPDFSNFIDDFDDTPTFFEVVPPIAGKEEKRYKRHCKYLRELVDRVDIAAINLPEINNESSKSKKGKRRSPFRRRVSPRAYARALRRQFDLDFVVNRVIVKENCNKQENWLYNTYHKYDISNVILVGGESSKVNYNGPSVTEGNTMGKYYLNRGKRQYVTDDDTISKTNLAIGNISIPTRRRSDFDEPERMLKKVQSGADFFTTQIVAEPEYPVSLLRDFSHLLSEKDQSPPLIQWSFSPISEQKDVDFLRWLGVYIPDSVAEDIISGDNPAQRSIERSLSIWEELCELNEQLPVSLPMGINISVMGLRNFRNGIALAESLQEVKTPSL